MLQRDSAPRLRGLSDRHTGVLLVIPGLAMFLAIILYPFVSAIVMSFTDRSLIRPTYEFVGFANYAKVLSDPYFGQTVLTTAAFALLSTALPFLLGLIWQSCSTRGSAAASFCAA